MLCGAQNEQWLKNTFLTLFSHLFFGVKLTILPCSSMLKKWSQKEVKNVFFALFKNASTRQKGRFCPKMGVEKCVKKHVFLNSFQVLHKWSPVTRPSGDLQEDIQYLLFYPSFLMKYWWSGCDPEQSDVNYQKCVKQGKGRFARRFMLRNSCGNMLYKTCSFLMILLTDGDT